MATGITAQPPRPPRRRMAWRITAVLAAVIACAGFAAWAWWPRPPAPPAPDDPRLTFATPYRNVRPGVGYVGDSVCAKCHAPQARTYRHHPMGRSFAPVAQAAAGERYGPAVHNPFDKFGLHFAVERRGGHVFHVERRRGAGGRVVAEVAAEAAYVMGSGTRGRSYLVNRDGYLFQSPISWFTQAGVWDVSPGFRGGQHFNRPIDALCLFCHANDAEPVEHTLNRYRTPLFRGHAIGCERCHGPGELHVGRRQRGEAVADLDDTIVNPRRLEPALRDAVCQQCHLQGEKRILRRGRQPFDYRPGLPLHLFWSVFVRLPDLADDRHAVGQVEQMADSRCFRGSGGKLGCISCHDPHELPAPEASTAYYRDRCLKCHAEQGCRESFAARHKNGNDCRACHMPRRDSSDIAHTAVTDHRIRRRPGKHRPQAPRPLDPGEIPLVHYHRELVAPHDREVSRDLGLALIELARQHGPEARPLAPLALPLLEGAAHRHPDDVPALEARAYALWLDGRPAEALDAFDATLARAPGRERALDDAASLAAGMKRDEEALGYSRRAVQVNPWMPSYRLRLARLLSARGDWRGAAAECQAFLRLEPSDLSARTLLVRCYIRMSQKDQARAAFAALLEFEPPDRAALERWFAEEMRQGGAPP